MSLFSHSSTKGLISAAMNFCRIRRGSSWSAVKSMCSSRHSEALAQRANPESRHCLNHLWIPGSRFAPRNDENSQPHLPRREILHDLLGPAADRIDLHFTVDALDLDAAHKTGAAKNLHGLGGAERHGLR